MHRQRHKEASIILYLSIILLLFIPITTHSEDNSPKIFPTRRAALKNGCEIQSVKYRNIDNCIIGKFDGHDLLINIYDSASNGKFVRTNQLNITSWYNQAKIGYDDLLGNGIKFIKVEFEGNTGTGTLQKILAYFGWKKDRFIPVFFETKSYSIAGQYLEKLTMTYEFHKEGSKQVSVVLNYHYVNNHPNHKSKYTWTENLTWNDSSFSFYNQKLENEKLAKSKKPIYEKIINARLNYMKHKDNMTNIDVDLLNEIEIMQILYVGGKGDRLLFYSLCHIIYT